MPKDRRYTRKELETLRRADLQSLFKMHGMKGANQSTKLMIDALVSLFESSSYFSPNRRNVGAKVEKSKKVLGGSSLGLNKGIKDIKKRSTAVRPVVEEVISPCQPMEEIRTEDILVSRGGPSQSRSPTSMPPPSLPTSAPRSFGISQARVQEMMDSRDRIWESRLAAMEEAFERRVKDLEQRLEETIRGLNVSLNSAVPQFTLTNSTPTNTILGKRTERDDSTQTPGAGPSHIGSSPVSKRQRVETTEDDDSDVQSPHTPPFRASAVPRTPSPSHQGIMTDNSRTPGIENEFYPPQFSSKRQEEDEEVTGLTYPVFATTPRPSEPRSPTLDAPPSANRHRLNYPRGITLTPGRRIPSPAPRSVSEAHKELTTITESDEPSIPISLARRRVASEHTPARLVPAAMRGSSVPVSPPQLSPSPSIGATDREGGFTYTPFPAVPRANLLSGLKKSTLGRRDQSSPDSPREGRELKRSISPLDYMEVAMHGVESMSGLGEGGIMATPHRTMLGTERYRDTRFGDVPMVSWGSPSIDLGPNTPASVSRRAW